MSVYKPAKSRLWAYDFRYKGRRFHGSTGQTARRAAESVERQRRQEAALGQLDAAATLTIDQAAGRWWAEVGIRRADAAKLENRLGRLLLAIPKTTCVIELDQTAVAAAIERRRGLTYTRAKPRKSKPAKTYLPANATVNRDVCETLRPILKRARTHWGVTGLPEIDWRELRLPEPREQVRVYSEAEQAAWLDQCNVPAARLALDLLLTYGLRFGELFFPLTAYEPEGPRLAWMKGRKRDIPHILPLLPRHAAEIAAALGRAAAAKLEHIWFVDDVDAEGQPCLRSLTYGGLEARLSSAAKRAGIRLGRHIHGSRHHAGSRILRQTRNLKAVQRLLGHADISSSMRYAHLLDDELRDTLEAGDPATVAAAAARAKGSR